MNMAEAAANRELVARVESLETQLKDLTRRLDDLSKAHRLLVDKPTPESLAIKDHERTLGLKKANG